MKRIIDIDMKIDSKSFEKALNKFFKKNPDLDYWRETFEYMNAEHIDFFSDNITSDGVYNKEWKYALHLDEEENYFYFAIIERGEG